MEEIADSERVTEVNGSPDDPNAESHLFRADITSSSWSGQRGKDHDGHRVMAPGPGHEPAGAGLAQGGRAAPLRRSTETE